MLHRGLRMSTVVLHIVLILGACMMALPFVWMVLSSLKDLSQVFVVPPKWIPDPFIWSIIRIR